MMIPRHVKQAGLLPLDDWIEEGWRNYLLGFHYENTNFGALLCVCTMTTRSSRLRLTLKETIKKHENGHILAGVVVDTVYAHPQGNVKALPGVDAG